MGSGRTLRKKLLVLPAILLVAGLHFYVKQMIIENFGEKTGPGGVQPHLKKGRDDFMSRDRENTKEKKNDGSERNKEETLKFQKEDVKTAKSVDYGIYVVKYDNYDYDYKANDKEGSVVDYDKENERNKSTNDYLLKKSVSKYKDNETSKFDGRHKIFHDSERQKAKSDDKGKNKKLLQSSETRSTRMKEIGRIFTNMLNSRARKLILLTYMRSGSSITGSLIQLSPDVFYVYEPLFSLQKTYSNQDGLHYLHKTPLQLNLTGSKMKHEDFYEPKSLAVDTVRNFLNCRLEDVDLRTLRQPHMQSSYSTRQFANCIHRNSSTKNVEDCFNAVRPKCLSAAVTSVKVIRMTMKQARILVEADPQVRVLHLIRDPRAMLNSQAGLRFRRTNLQTESRLFCDRITQDLLQHSEIAKLYPNRTLLVRFEDIIASPEKAITQIYSLVTLNATDAIISKILSRAGDKERPYHWRRDLTFDTVSIIDLECKELCHLLGYRPITSQELLQDKRVSTVDRNFATSLAMRKVLV